MYRNHRFFDSTGPGGIPNPRPSQIANSQAGQELEIGSQNIIQYAHHGYVYCMLLFAYFGELKSENEVLISGGGDGLIKIWSFVRTQRRGLSVLTELENGDEPVLSIAVSGTILYSGRAEGSIDVWDLDTRQLIRSISVSLADVLTITAVRDFIYSGSADGFSRTFDSKSECLAKWRSHDQLVLASSSVLSDDKDVYITGGNDDSFVAWDIVKVAQRPKSGGEPSSQSLLTSLAAFISFRTVSSMPQYAEDCRRGASWLRKTFKRYGAETHMLNTSGSYNPIVLARFHGDSKKRERKKSILFYGHYDVVPAENDQHAWSNNPFEMHGNNGYLYGRGASDNKGPLLAAMYAVIDLIENQNLNCDVVFLIEGEEECGSRGFQDAVKANRQLIGHIDWILLANSYWLDDEFPCLTYGLRGVVRATVAVKSPHPDLHSGVDGSHLIDEALKDLLATLATLTGPKGEVAIPNFYDPIPPVTQNEEKHYAATSKILLLRDPTLGDARNLIRSLKARWREPSLTIHRVETSGPANSTIIPSIAKATISMRLVPNQCVKEIRRGLEEHLARAFSKLRTSNELSIVIEHQAEPWLGDPSNGLFKTLEKAVMDVWGATSHTRRSSIPHHPLHPASPNKNGIADVKSQPATSSTLASGNGTSDHTILSSRKNGSAPNSPTKSGDQSSSLQLKQPLYIREGGSIPAIRFLEEELQAPAAHLPCGQASDSAHLDNERIRLVNLYNSRAIFRSFFREIAVT